MEIQSKLKNVFYKDEVEALAEQFENAPTEDLLKWAVDTLGDRLGVVTSFQSSGMVMIDMLTKIDPKIRVLTVDTGRLHEETYAFMDRVRERYNLNLEVLFPDHQEVQKMVAEDGMNLFYRDLSSRYKCCHIRKVAPLKKALKSVDGWMAGLRRDQSNDRFDTPKIMIDYQYSGILKFNPLADWTEEQVKKYLQEHEVPVHPLFNFGFKSIGCAPCTRPIQINENIRAGRWWWEENLQKECGIHLQSAG